MEYKIEYTLNGKKILFTTIKATSMNAARVVFQINNPLATIISIKLI